MSKRNYNKKSEYWDKFGNPNNVSIAQESQVFSPELCGDPFYVSDASYVSESRASVSRTSSGGMQTKTRINDNRRHRYRPLSFGVGHRSRR